MASPGVAAEHEPPFSVDFARTQLVDGVYQLNAGIRYELSPALFDALHNGVTLVFEVQVDIHRLRAWWLDAHVATVTQRYRLEYHALSRLYLVTHLNTGVQQSFFRFSSVLAFLGELDAVPLLDASLLDSDSEYEGRLRARLAVDALPLPLRVRAFLSPDWSPASDWYTWSLR
ncbi:hypothetical protein B1C78_01285 [Thioalkalivibrio denitrificans]|uniref:DUF4390 domain-containing protein n=2 Tax=Thioalkalivibrio denitrificans TaxID=108003 RepID=A0A1V3NUL7_9GAMM|nr:hypothetical protein B1C78_01285 [Thioalkalivibrio denitrificans]